jgi:hypothetical protein
MKFWNGVKKFFFDLFTDIRDMFDEKRFWGNVLMASGIVYAFVNPSTVQVWVVSGGFLGFGTLCLGIAAKTDASISGAPVPSIIETVVDKVQEIIAPAKDGN